MNIKEKLRELPIRPYYNIPQCPYCGSRMSGRYVKNHRYNDISYVITDALKHGELVKAVPEVPEYFNVFCVECKAEWHHDVKLSFISTEQLNNEKKSRFTEEILAERMESEAEETEQRRRVPVLGTIAGFIGKI